MYDVAFGRSMRRLALGTSTIAGLMTAMTGVHAQTTCPPTATSCSVNTQTLGDTSNPSSASGTTSNSSLSGTSAASNVSGLTISPDIRTDTQQNSTNTTTGTITGGNVTGGNVTGGNVTGGSTTSSAQGGTSTGNTTSANNQSSATSGPSNAAIGNTTTGPSSATVGNTSVGPSTTSVGNTTTGPSNAAVGNTSATTGNLSGGTNTTSNVNSTGGSSSATNIDASNRSVSNNNERWTFIPPVVPPTPPSSLAVGNVVSETSACGPLQRVVREPIEGRFFGLVTNSHVQQGFNERLEPYFDEHGVRQDYRRVPLEDGSGYRLFGHQVTQHTTIVGISGTRNLALGGGGGGGGWGQAGAGSSSAMQQMVTSIQLRECEIGSYVTRPPVVYVEPAHIRQ